MEARHIHPLNQKAMQRPAILDDPPAAPAEEGSELGAIRVHNSVIAAIARIVTLKVPGVLEMSGSFAEGLASVVGKASFDGGIKVAVEGQTLNLDIYVTLVFGVRIPQVAWQIQNDVRQALVDLTGKKVGLVNVIIRGIKQKGQAAGPAGGVADSRPCESGDGAEKEGGGL